MKNNGDIVSFLRQKDYVMINNTLGSGCFGKTVLIQDSFIDELFVAKKYEPEFTDLKEQFYKSFLQEIKILYKLIHTNIVRIFSYYPYDKIFIGYIVMEYVDGITIDRYFNDYDPFGDSPDPNNIFQQLINGFKYLEDNNVLHRDIREGNIMIDNSGIVKIIDFGLGKIFKPTEVTDDSLVDIINRFGLDTLPNEYFDGVYDSQTDMFYLAELFNRLLKKSENEVFFSYKAILNKMMQTNKNNRYENFTTVQEAINKKDFSTLSISSNDKKIYQAFSNEIISHLSHYSSEKKFNYDIDDFSKKLKLLIQKNCFEDEIQDVSDLISIIVLCGYYYRSNFNIHMDIVTNFESWFAQLATSSKRLVLNNMIAKLSSAIKEVIEISEDEIPF